MCIESDIEVVISLIMMIFEVLLNGPIAKVSKGKMGNFMVFNQ